jgi:hypothetical protein
MTAFWPGVAAGLVLLGKVGRCHALERTVSRQALEWTLKQQLFSGPDGRYYLKGNAQSGCFISTEDPHLIFEQDWTRCRTGSTKVVPFQSGFRLRH